MSDEDVKQLAPVTKPVKMAKVQVIRDYWDDEGVRHRGPWEEQTNETEADEAGRIRVKVIKHEGEVLSVPVALAEQYIDAGIFKAYLR